MYKISIEKDHGKMIFDLTGMTCIPAIGPDSDMDGHDLSSLTYRETLEAEEFVDNFNEKYADKATLVSIWGMPVILVKDFMIEDGEDLDIDFDEFGEPCKDNWKQLFNMTEEEAEYYLQEYKKLAGKK